MSIESIQEQAQTRPPAEDPRWSLVERILQTEDFLRAPRLAEFLRYICRVTLEGCGSELHEQRIGEVVFGRTPPYDSSADTVVRSNALRLRRRLEEYFLHEGRAETLRVEIPRGGYVPQFYPVEKEAPVVSDAPLQNEKAADSPVREAPDVFPIPERNRDNRLHRKWIKPALAGVFLLALTIVFAVLANRRHDAAIPSTHAEIKQSEIDSRFWSSLFPPNGKTIVVPGDSGLVLYETLTGKELNLADYLGGAYRDPSHFGTAPSSASQVSSSASQISALSVASRRYTSIVDLDLSSKLSGLPQWNSQRASIVFARDLRPSDADGSNLILIGSREANPWVCLMEPAMNFLLTPDKKWGFHFLNRHPKPGELAEYTPQELLGGIGAPAVYGDVAYLPNPSGNGMVLVLSGLWMSGTQSAGDFVFHEAQFSNWLKSIANSDGTIPPFEVLIATRSLESNAMDSSIIAKRVYAK